MRNLVAALLSGLVLAGCTGDGGGTGSGPVSGGGTNSPSPQGFATTRLLTPAIYQRATGNWSVLEGAQGQLRDTRFVYGGDSSDLPVLGDFDGNGVQDVGLFRRAIGRWYLLTQRVGSQVQADVQVRFGGEPTDVPLVGDWDGNGRDDLAVYRAAQATWYLAVWNGPGDVTALASFRLTPGSAVLPVVGDFDGDGADDVGVFEPATGLWALDFTKDGVPDETFYYGGVPTDVPVAGDWDGDAVDEVGLFRRDTWQWFLCTGREGANVFDDQQLRYGGDPSDLPLVGDFDSDGRDDPGLYRRATGEWYLVTGRSGDQVTSDLQFLYGGQPSDMPLTSAAAYDLVLRTAAGAGGTVSVGSVTSTLPQQASLRSNALGGSPNVSAASVDGTSYSRDGSGSIAIPGPHGPEVVGAPEQPLPDVPVQDIVASWNPAAPTHPYGGPAGHVFTEALHEVTFVPLGVQVTGKPDPIQPPATVYFAGNLRITGAQDCRQGIHLFVAGDLEIVGKLTQDDGPPPSVGPDGLPPTGNQVYVAGNMSSSSLEAHDMILMAGGSLETGANSHLRGVLYARGGGLVSGAHTSLAGLLLAPGGDVAAQGADLQFDPSVVDALDWLGISLLGD